MIGILLSLGALNALIPLLVIIILIGAAGMSTRNFSFFNLFGIHSLFGFTGGQGRSSLRGKSPTWHTMGPKSVFLKSKNKSLSKVSNQAYFPFQIKMGNKLVKINGTFVKRPRIVQAKGSSIQYMHDQKAWIKDAKTAMFAGKSISISTNPDEIREWEFKYDIWKQEGRKGPPPPMPEPELERLRQRHPDYNALDAEIGEKAANLRKVGLVISQDEGHRGMGIRPKGKLNLNRPYVVKKAEDEYLANVAAEKGKGVAKKEKDYASIAMARLLWERQKHLGPRHQEVFDRLSATTKRNLDELDDKFKKGSISQKDYNAQKKQNIRRFEKQSKYFYDTAHRGMTAGETLTAGKAFATGVWHSIRGNEAEAGKHFQRANEMFARGLQYHGGNTFGKKDDAAAQYKVSSENAPQYMSSGKVLPEDADAVRLYEVRKKKRIAEAEKQKKEDKEKEEAAKKASGNEKK